MESLKVFKSSEAMLQIVYGEVYAPNTPNSDNEYMVEEEIRKMAHGFLRDKKNDKIDMYHNNRLVEGASVVESFIARKGDPDFIEGAWVVGVHIPDPEIWDKVMKGEINGFSMEALVKKIPREVSVELPPVVKGTTSVAKSDSTQDHQHDFFVTYSAKGEFLGGTTNEVDGHVHVIRGGTVTEESEGHRHRFSSVDNVKIVE